MADTAQKDWHSGQILPSTDLSHALFVDFASVTQTHRIDEMNLVDNFAEALVDELVWAHFGMPDDWDVTYFTVCSGGEKIRSVRAREMFPWIYWPEDHRGTQ